MMRKCQIQIGDKLLDAEIEIDIEQVRRTVKEFNLPWMNVGITDDKIVEGSLVEPITDENRLLDHAEQ